VPTVAIPASPLAPGVSPVTIFYRDEGAGPALVVLHGGWGYDIYPFDRQIAVLAAGCRIVIPDRTGYGRSGTIAEQPIDFHQRAAVETFAVMEALGLERPVLWGHSDGAVIALLMGLSDPERIAGIIAEATHFYRSKPASRAFFDTMMQNPDGLGDRVVGVLAGDHGERWRDLIRMNGVAWRRIGSTQPQASSLEPQASERDLYAGRLPQLRVPTLILHGAKDPRTEPGELEALRAALPAARVAIIADGGHSPHSERLAADDATAAARQFLLDVTRGAIAGAS
jgi:pimeloyl-ACP methyl ester carboxylesterase